MFRNNNDGVIRELARDNFKAHGTRNFITVLAIALTMVLITAVLTVGISFTSTILNYGESGQGPGAHGIIYGTKEQSARIKELPQINWADYIKKCSTSSLRNEAFAGQQIWLMAPEESYYQHNYVDLIDGRYPKGSREIIISDSMAEHLHLDHPVGSELELKMLIGENGHTQEKIITFTICGYFRNPLVALVNQYDEIYTSEQFLSEDNPQLVDEPGEIFVNLNNLNPLLLKSDVMERLGEVNDAVGGKGTATKYSNDLIMLLFGIIPALFFVLVIILSGYFLVYNVFYISVAADIRWFGMMKTLGTTPRQLKRVLILQIRKLAAVGILVGAGIGYLIGNKLGPGIMEQTVYGQFYQAPNMWLIFLLGAVFVWLTVWLGGRRAIKTAARISPVEAVRFTPKKQRNLFTVLSLALSGVILMVVLNGTLGYDVERMVERYNINDAEIYHHGGIWDLDREAYQPIDFDLPAKIKALPYVETVDIVYQARTMPDWFDLEGSPHYLSSQGRIKASGQLKKHLDTKFDRQSLEGQETYKGDARRLEDGDICLYIIGLPANRLADNDKFVRVLDGQIDWQKFATGDYILWQDISSANMDDNKLPDDYQIRAGDSYLIGFYNDVTEDYVEKEVTVMAVIENNDIFGTSDIGMANITMSDTVFQELYPDYQERISDIQIITDTEITAEQNQEINTLISQTHNTQLRFESRYLTRQEQYSSLHTMRLVGMFLAALLGIIGLSNVINTITSDVLARKIELAALQSIGMTKKQLWWLLLTDTVKFSIAALLLILPLGGVLSYLVTSDPTFSGFSLLWYIYSAVLIVIIVMGVELLTVSILVKLLNKRSIVERLRDIE
ncbi:MAG: FtsX-like permease family protein [Lachnospiraceae bacterium]